MHRLGHIVSSPNPPIAEEVDSSVLSSSVSTDTVSPSVQVDEIRLRRLIDGSLSAPDDGVVVVERGEPTVEATVAEPCRPPPGQMAPRTGRRPSSIAGTRSHRP